MIQSKYKIYVDLDGVLVDWEKQFKIYSGGVSPDVYEELHGVDHRYELVHKNSPEFYANAPWTRDGKILYNFIKEFPAEILSHSTDKESTTGKKAWLEKNKIGIKQNLVANRTDKSKYAEINTILIDDRNDVIDEFNAAGGIGILHTNATDTINKLKNILGVKEKFRIYNSILNPEFWTVDILKPNILEKLYTIASTFYKDTELNAPIEDIIFLGSSTGYNWTPTSDIDLHVVIDFNKIDENTEFVKKLMSAYKNKWNEQHNVYIGAHKVELYIQNINEENRSQGAYSILNNAWIKKPSYENVRVDKRSIKIKYHDFVKQIDFIIKSGNLSKMKEIIKHIYDMRESGLSTGGEYSTENIVFKLLRASGYISKLRASISKEVDIDLNKI